MTLSEAIAIIEHYQKWRMGAEIEMIHPKILTKALDLILGEVKKHPQINEGCLYAITK